jgi:hypothetical protein
LVYQAGNSAREGCWEPAAIQLSSGEIQLFFANEFPYPSNSDDQEITRLRSFDGGVTWSKPETVCYRAGHRDGMPVPVLLRGNNNAVTLAIEDNGLMPGSKLQPAIVDASGGGNNKPSVVDGNSRRRWGAIRPPLSGRVYAGASLPSTNAHGSHDLVVPERRGWSPKAANGRLHRRPCGAKLRHPSVPFPIPTDVGGMWNSLFVKDARTVTAISDTVVNGVHGLWAIDGRLVLPGDAPAR